jgi:hypothetical protein
VKEHHISVSYKRTKNLGNYESLTAELTVMAHVDDDEDSDSCIYFLQSKARQAVTEFLNKEDDPDQFVNVQSVHKIAGLEVK